MKRSFEVAARGYLKNRGVEVMAFDDYYAASHQSGVSIIMHGNRVASNGDIRIQSEPGGRGYCSACREKGTDPDNHMIWARAEYPDVGSHDPARRSLEKLVRIEYKVRVIGEGDQFRIAVDLQEPLPEETVGFARFVLELFPAPLTGKPWIMDEQGGIFPQQANGPAMPAKQLQVKLTNETDFHQDAEMYAPLYDPNFQGVPYASGHCLTVLPDDPERRLTIESPDQELLLSDARFSRYNGWFVVSSLIPGGKTEAALEWIVKPGIIEDWLYKPVIQTSQVGYHTKQPKIAVVELDEFDSVTDNAVLYKITPVGRIKVKDLPAEKWGNFLRYRYLRFDFTDVKEEGLYQITYQNSGTTVFRIASDVYDRGVWQPVLEYFLPVQMCHMRVNDKGRCWHDLCHMDDAKMAPISRVHFDGYRQGPSTLTRFKSGDCVPGLNMGGWHDAGDDDLRIESQAGECYILAMAYEEFGVNYDTTTISQEMKIVEIHQPDGKNDIQQQIEHGLLSAVGAYQALGRLYRGIIANDTRQYGLLGDPAAMTKNIIGDSDDRWVFTEDNPRRELTTAGQFAACARSMRGFNETLAVETLKAAEELFENTDENKKPDPAELRFIGRGSAVSAKIFAAAELYLTTGNEKYRNYILSKLDFICENIKENAWAVCRVVHELEDDAFTDKFREALLAFRKDFMEASGSTPYGVPYNPDVWGDGWTLQRRGFQYYFIQKAFPDLFPEDPIFDTVNFVLGCHPGSNTESFASGVGAKSTIHAYGWNRADWSYIPGGVISGTAMIRPDFPELLVYPFLWQQTEYVLGGGSSHYMFLVLAAKALLDK